jgi:4-amino-4-deoxy-L-arabinose transferase-like glycosyltransferase
VIPTDARARRNALLVGALLLAWFLAFTGARPLNVPDEGRYAEVAREMLVTGDWVTPRLNGVPFLDKPPLFYWMEATAFALFGVHTWTARLPPALLAVAGCLLVMLAGARLHGWRAGLLGAIVLAANPFYFGASQYVNHDLGVAVWVSGALLAFAVGLTTERSRAAGWIVAGCLSAGLALLTKGLIGIVFPVGITGLWMLLTWRWSRAPWAALGGGLLLCAALVLPWTLAVQRANPDFFHYFFVTQHFERFTGGSFNNPQGPAFYFLLLAGGLLPWTPLLPAALRRAAAAFRADRADHGASLLLILWPALVVLFFSIPRSKIAGYVLPALPPLATLLGVWWDVALRKAEGRQRSIGLSAWIMLAFAAFLVLTPRLVAPALRLSAASVALLTATGIATLLPAALVLLGHRSGRLGLALGGHVAFAALFSAGALLTVPSLVRDGTQSLAERIRPLLQEGDRVVCYRKYFYDLPFYLGRHEPLLVAYDWDDPAIEKTDDWRREFWLGLRWRPEAAAWMVTPERFRELCAGDGARCFVVVLRADAAELERLALVPLGEAGDKLLLATRAAARPNAPPR